MSRHHFKWFLFPTPIFKHLTWRFDKVLLNLCSGKVSCISLRADFVDDMAELVEEGDNLLVFKQGWLCHSGLCKICQHCTYSNLERGTCLGSVINSIPHPTSSPYMNFLFYGHIMCINIPHPNLLEDTTGKWKQYLNFDR